MAFLTFYDTSDTRLAYLVLVSVFSAWQPVVKLAAVDCADMKNEPLCREHRVAAYPTLKVSYC